LAAASLDATTPLFLLGGGIASPFWAAAVPTIVSNASNAAMTKMTNTIFRLSDIVGLLAK
jgi:hypothetical protein